MTDEASLPSPIEPDGEPVIDLTDPPPAATPGLAEKLAEIDGILNVLGIGDPR